MRWLISTFHNTPQQQYQLFMTFYVLMTVVICGHYLSVSVSRVCQGILSWQL